MTFRLLLIFAWIASTGLAAQPDSSYHRALKLMGCRFDLTVIAADAKAGARYLDLAVGEISRIERLISSWDSASQTSEVNRMAGIRAVVVDPELYGLISRAIGISQLTDGAFDISYASMDKVWHFDGTMTAMPDPAVIAASVDRVGYRRIVLNEEEHSVYLPVAGMKIGFGAIGKGYAADRARALLEQSGVKAGIVNASGDLTAWGKQPGGKDWLVAITNPLNRAKAFAWLPVDNRAVVTSGDYEKYVTFDGTRYAHIIDPRTGYPATGIVSATVFAPKAELADALATSIFVMGTEIGLDFINQLPGVDVIIIDGAGQLHTSAGIDLQNVSQHD
ncbi:thiamine biosynthesis lipoprotein [Neolewinella xylanilytica]|uniref:FAD:protein FMN transferase n=1 Tax=Neolewinella xylanilytica TaxID=1514080 RepID=A0A2S6I4X3_9BACT|nr:FAD:protein FMN transferase [Neolewinella xylanilytica]PPK86205.1 thiamine biosynthesis lipoprotein [Neolewinella xylanilytica]